MITTLGETTDKITDLGDLAQVLNALLKDGMHPGTPISINGDYSEFKGGDVSMRINLNGGNEDEQIIDFFADDEE